MSQETRRPFLRLGDQVEVAGIPGKVAGFDSTAVYIEIEGREIKVDRRAVEDCVLKAHANEP